MSAAKAEILERIREDPRVEFGASPRAGLMLVKAAKALAALEGRDHVLPDDVQELVPSVLAHRLLLSPAAVDVARLDVLGDALEDAGCTDADLLGHLRGPGPHWRGCWAIDALTGRQ